MKKLLLLLLSVIGISAMAQVTVTPAFPSADEEITIVYDATQGTSGLVGASSVMMHSGVILSGATGTGWQNVKGEWGNPGSVGQMTSLGSNKWQIKITPRSYFGVAAGTTIYRIGMVFRSAGPCGGFAGNNTTCKEGKSTTNSDIFVDLYEGNQLQIDIVEPANFPVFKDQGDELQINASISNPSDVTVKINGSVVLTEDDVAFISYTHTVAEASGSATVLITADDGTEIKEVLFSYIIRTAVTNQPRPQGIKDGINYGTDATKVTLSLWAPLKNSVYAVGDFSDWEISPAYLMKKDGEHFWIEVSGLTPGQEYGFQYLVDETLYMADPYADKILDPDDQFIPAEIYPSLKPYPAGAVREQSYFNRVAVFQTNQTSYAWQTSSYVKPKKEELVIYELLVRDFFSKEERNYQNLIDTLAYFKRLGVNAIELMPITEFNGNESWGYNPTFMLAPDKAYGTKNKLKEFIDRCHQEGIAVILDVVMNQQDLPNPYVLMHYDFTAGKPGANSPWFNQDATHPFNVFFDMNHESAYTQQYLDTVTHYWINEYKFDGYRFDLSKGFTQKNAAGNVSEWGKYDASRIAILKRMADKIWDHSPDAYVILEHFADNSEEKELAEYRSSEGKGMLLWGNYNNAYSQNAQGNSGTDFSSIYHVNRNWTVPHAVGYMESHDEDRLMYRNLQSGKSSGTYSVKTLATALDRIKAASLMFYTIPGPKMLWQFGELGYDQSINRCEDGTISDGCRVSPKPVHWDYRAMPERYAVYSHVAELLELRKNHDVFREGIATIPAGSSLVKQIGLKNSPYTATPADASEMNVQLIANFDVVAKDGSISFPHTGIWYEYYNEQVLSVTSASQTVSLAPGEYRLYTDYPLKGEPVTGVEDELANALLLYPNPADDVLSVNLPNISFLSIQSIEGKRHDLLRLSDTSWSLAGVNRGLYVVEVKSNNRAHRIKLFKR